METERLMDGLTSEINSALRGLAKAKTVEEKVAYSQIVKNLCDSLGVFLDAASEMMTYGPDDYED